MSTTLLTAGIACFIAAIVGGGLKAFGIEIPVLNSRFRQLALGGFGIILTFAGFLLDIYPSRQSSKTDARKISEQYISGAEGCLQEYVRSIPKDRISYVEAGTKDHQVIGPHQSKDRPVAILFTENRQPLGAIKFQFYSGNNIFKIDSVIDSGCQPIEDYANATRGGDKNVLQNWDVLQVRFGNAEYSASLEFDDGKIDTDFIRISPTP